MSQKNLQYVIYTVTQDNLWLINKGEESTAIRKTATGDIILVSTMVSYC